MNLDYSRYVEQDEEPKEYIECWACGKTIEKTYLFQKTCFIHTYYEKPPTKAELLQNKTCTLCGESFKAYLGYNICVNCYLDSIKTKSSSEMGA